MLKVVALPRHCSLSFSIQSFASIGHFPTCLCARFFQWGVNSYGFIWWSQHSWAQPNTLDESPTAAQLPPHAKFNVLNWNCKEFEGKHSMHFISNFHHKNHTVTCNKCKSLGRHFKSSNYCIKIIVHAMSSYLGHAHQQSTNNNNKKLVKVLLIKYLHFN